MKRRSRLLASRPIDTKYLKRASQVESSQVGPYLDAILLDMHKALDAWRFGKGPYDDLVLATDAFLALITEAEARGLAK